MHPLCISEVLKRLLGERFPAFASNGKSGVEVLRSDPGSDELDSIGVLISTSAGRSSSRPDP